MKNRFWIIYPNHLKNLFTLQLILKSKQWHFLSALFLDKKFISYRDNCLVFKEESVLPRLAQGSKSFIAITDNKNVEKELAQYSQQIHALLFIPKIL